MKPRDTRLLRALRKIVAVACRDYRQNWAALDQVLYNLCRRHPDHSRCAINAKLWIVGRAYGTGIERQIKSDGSPESAMDRLAERFAAHRRQLDTILRGLRGVREPLTPGKLTQILDAHGQFVRLMKQKRIVRHGTVPRSFASKYLHFHHPAVPIYDSVAVELLTGMYPRTPVNEEILVPKGADQKYAEFVGRFWRIYQEARISGVKITVKLVDHCLLTLAKRATRVGS